MKLIISENSKELGKAAAAEIAARLNSAISANNYARIVLSTGASQFEMFEALIYEKVDWGKVEMFHLDEYIGLPDTHKASFCKYLNERFVSKVPLYKANLIQTRGDIDAVKQNISEKLLACPVDVGVIGIGENSHIAFNDPPADFKTQDPYIIVNLDENCKRQQVREGWFENVDSVPNQAISMSVHRIMMCKSIISVVPHMVKAKAIKNALESDVCPEVPAAMLRMHPDWSLYLDKNSASLL